MTIEVVRVGTSNNFNCTQSEWSQLDSFAKANPDKSFFVNCNVHTPKLKSIAKHNYKAVVTANPGLTITESGIDQVISRLDAIKPNIAFVRVKYIPDDQNILHLLMLLAMYDYPIVITLQRFISQNCLEKYTKKSYYTHSCSRFRLSGIQLKKITTLVDTWSALNVSVWICDRSGKGCRDCQLCSTLTTGDSYKITSLNLSTSGICPYNCPDCYAKAMQNFSTKCGHRPMVFDKIRQNDKQAGKTKHIQLHNKL